MRKQRFWTIAVWLAVFAMLWQIANIQTQPGLNELLGEYHYTSDYHRGVFDCSQMCLLLDTFLEGRGISSFMAISQPLDENKTRHCWVLAAYGGHLVKIEPTADPLHRIGVVVEAEPTQLDREIYENVTFYDGLEDILRGMRTRREDWETNETIVRNDNNRWVFGFSHPLFSVSFSK